MPSDPFSELHCAGTGIPQIRAFSPIAVFCKERIGDKIRYTKIQDGEIKTFEHEEYIHLHKNQNFVLMYVLQGELTNLIEERRHLMRAAEGCLLNTQVMRTEMLSDGCSVVFLNLSPALLDELLANNRSEGPIFQFLLQNLQYDSQWKRSYIEFSSLPPYASASFQAGIDLLQLEVAASEIGSAFFQRGLVLRILSALENPDHFALQQISLDSSRDDHLVHRLIHLIESRSGDISRRDIEAFMHYNAEYLNRLLKNRTKMTIANYAQKIRTQKAEHLLNTTDSPVRHIAEQLGFSNETYFYHYFKKQTGFSPNQYRQKFRC